MQLRQVCPRHRDATLQMLVAMSVLTLSGSFPCTCCGIPSSLERLCLGLLSLGMRLAHVEMTVWMLCRGPEKQEKKKASG